MAPPGLPLGRWIMAGATGRRCDASRTIQPDLFLTGAATWGTSIYQTLHIIYHAEPTGMMTPTAEGAHTYMTT